MPNNQNEKSMHPMQNQSGEQFEQHILRITQISSPFPSIVRVKGTITPDLSDLLQKPNVAVRIQIGQTDMEQPIVRIYTIRSFDVKTNTVEIDFVNHIGESPAMNWLKQMTIGSEAKLVSLRQHFVPDYEQQRKTIFFADDTGIPAIYSILQQWPQNARALIYIECIHPQAAAELPDAEGVEKFIHILPKDKHAGTSQTLVQAAEALKDVNGCQIWAACEREEARAIRKHFMEDCGIAKDDIKAIGYWRLGVSSSELDTARMKHFSKLISEGKTQKDFNELDISV